VKAISPKEALLRYARELDRQTVLTKAILEDRAPDDAVKFLLAGDNILRAKLAVATGALGRAA
jgi:hypothetical protein